MVGIKRKILESMLPQTITETQFHDVRTVQISKHVFLVL